MRVKFIGLLIFFTSLQAFAQEGYFIKSKDQTDIFIEEKGTGTPVVLLSGGPGLNPFYVYPIHEQLSKHFRSIILHQRGTGKTVMAKIDSTTLSLDKYVEDLEALRTHLQAKKLILIGQSWGGMLSMEYCSRYLGHRLWFSLDRVHFLGIVHFLRNLFLSPFCLFFYFHFGF